ncbi:hypothetical protein [Muribaculum gordoncarteri]|nr:hypothetical protein [Muribaculum gordoncarteri]
MRTTEQSKIKTRVPLRSVIARITDAVNGLRDLTPVTASRAII